MVRQRACTAAPRALYARTVKAQAVAASLALRSAESWAMPALTRGRYSKRSDCWHVYYGDVHVGTIVLRTAARSASTKREWKCGLYPGMEPGRSHNGSRIISSLTPCVRVELD